VIRIAVIVAVGAMLLVALSHGSADLNIVAVQYRHYYDIGMRECHKAPEHSASLSTTSSGGSTTLRTTLVSGSQSQVAIGTSKLPAKYRKAVAAGCRAAQ
jgi:hypothetical protein